MEELTRAFYEERFEKIFLRQKYLAFQDFFSDFMSKRYVSDFIPVKPWGKVGDRKCDGYLKSKRMLFQVYAPNEISATEAINKIEGDFHGALPYWRDYFDTWVFVHNSRQGLNPDIVRKLLSLEEESKSVRILHWGYEEIKQELFLLNENDLIALLGYAPTNRGMNELRFEQLREVLVNIAKQDPSQTSNIHPVPGNKIKYNMLSSNVEIMLTSGMRKANLVKNYFDAHFDPRFGDKVASSFKNRYEELKTIIIEPDEIFFELQKFAAGERRSNPGIECSILAVLAFLFEECEIFEKPE